MCFLPNNTDNNEEMPVVKLRRRRRLPGTISCFLGLVARAKQTTIEIAFRWCSIVEFRVILFYHVDVNGVSPNPLSANEIFFVAVTGLSS